MSNPPLIIIARFSGHVPFDAIALTCSQCGCYGLCRKCFEAETKKDCRILCEVCGKPVIQQAMLREGIVVECVARDAGSASSFLGGIQKTIKDRN